MKQFEKLKSFSYDVLPVYTLVTTLTLQDQAIQFYINHPSFAKTNANTILIFNKFKYKKYLAYLRFSTGYDETDEEIRITEWNRFPLTYENMGQFMFLEDCENQQCDINQNNLSLNAQLVDQMVKIRFSITENQYHNYNLSLAQYYQLQTHLKKSLTLMSGWMIPHQFQSIKKPQT